MKIIPIGSYYINPATITHVQEVGAYVDVYVIGLRATKDSWFPILKGIVDDAHKSPPRRLIHQLFISAYEDDSWGDADFMLARSKDGRAVELLATRKSDGTTLAIEHTLLEPFVGNKRDFAHFEPVFPSIQDDQSLVLPERWIRVFVPVGTLDGQKPAAREALAKAVHTWLRAKRLLLPDGDSQHSPPGSGGSPNLCKSTHLPEQILA